MGNHDYALVNAAGLGVEPDPFWVKKYATYDGSDDTFRSYLSVEPDSHSAAGWADWLRRLRDAMPASHRDFLAGLPWVAEAEGHVFLHNGLSPELDEPAAVQLELLRRRQWAGLRDAAARHGDGRRDQARLPGVARGRQAAVREPAADPRTGAGDGAPTGERAGRDRRPHPAGHVRRHGRATDGVPAAGGRPSCRCSSPVWASGGRKPSVAGEVTGETRSHGGLTPPALLCYGAGGRTAGRTVAAGATPGRKVRAS